MAKDIFIYGEIGYGTTLLDVQTAIAAANEDEELIVYVNSFGGDYFEGLGMYHALLESGRKVTTINQGYVASAATLPMLAGESRIGLEGSKFMVHFPFTFAAGNSKDMENLAASLKEIEGDVAKMYAKHSSIEASEWLTLMEAETEMNTATALEKGVYTEVREVQMSKYQKSVVTMSFIENFKKKMGLTESPKMLTLETSEEGALTIVEGEVAVGESVTVDGETAPAGDHNVGEQIITVDDAGVITEVAEVEADMDANERIDALEGQIAEMSAGITEMKEALMMMAEGIGSNHTPKQKKQPEMRKPAQAKKQENVKTLKERRAERSSK